MPGFPPPPRIAEAWMVGASPVVEVVFEDGLRGAADLRDLMPECQPMVVDNGAFLRWPNGVTLPAERLLGLILTPPTRRPAMRAREFASWADDGSDVRWELHRGTPIPRPGGSVGHGAVVGEIVARLHHVGGWRALAHMWVGGSPEDTDLRIADIAVAPDRPLVPGGTPWCDDAVAVVEIVDSSTAWTQRERLMALRRLPSLREIAVVGVVAEWARVERRSGLDPRWRLEEVGPEGTLRLTSIGAEIALADLRRDRER